MIPSGHSSSPSSASQAALGARSPHRQPLTAPITRPVTALLPVTDPAATMPAIPAVVVPVLAPPVMQDDAWRRRAIQLAWQTDWQSQATYSGHSARGQEVYAVPSSRKGHLTYQVRFIPDPLAITIHDGRYDCQCIAALHNKPCRHAGAALMLAQLRAEARDSIRVAEAERMSWAWAIHDGWSASADHLAWYRVGESVMRQWREVGVIWDTTRDVAIWCDCGRTVCQHIGAVALRVDKERRDYLRRVQTGYGPDWNADQIWDGAVLPASLV